MNTTERHASLWTRALAGALILATITASPASARQDAGPRSATVKQTRVSDLSCPLTRVGTQLVRCDNLTGHGVPAPLWVRER